MVLNIDQQKVLISCSIFFQKCWCLLLYCCFFINYTSDLQSFSFTEFLVLEFLSLEAKHEEIKGTQKAPNSIEVVNSEDGQNIC